MNETRVEVTRDGLVESIHRVHVVVADATGRSVAVAGDADFPTFLRSAAKPFQALPLVEDGVVDAFGIDETELALCCASHSSGEMHVAAARSLLARIGLDEGALACGGHPPLGAGERTRLRREGVQPGPIHSNCSGKHAGMLALARHHGWPTAGYEQIGHPVQQRMLAEVARWTGLDEGAIGLGVDGCGVACFRVPLAAAATAVARFAAAARDGGSAARVVAAMTRHPEMVAGPGRLCTALMEAGSGRIFAKTGAEGVYVAARPSDGLGVALKVEDGATRASEPATVAVLAALGWVDAGDDRLAGFREPPVMNTRGVEVGRVRAVVALAGMER